MGGFTFDDSEILRRAKYSHWQLALKRLPSQLPDVIGCCSSCEGLFANADAPGIEVARRACGGCLHTDSYFGAASSALHVIQKPRRLCLGFSDEDADAQAEN